MKFYCPHCMRRVRLSHARCKACDSKLTLWYIRVAILMGASIALILLILFSAEC